MTHHWQDTETGAELVVDGVVRGRVNPSSITNGVPSAEHVGCAWTDDGRLLTMWSADKQAAQRAAERALGLATPVTESPEFPPPNDSESPKGSTWSCSCGASGVAPDPGPEWCPKCGAGEDGVQRAPAPYDILADVARLVDVDRQAQYGDPVEAHRSIADAMIAIERVGDAAGEAECEAIAMIVRKLVRRMAGAEPRECYRDLIGYAVIAERCARA